MDLNSVKKKLSATRFVVPDQAFRLECTSLRPFTRFYVVFDKLDFSSFCTQDGKNLGEPLISDGYGKLNFTFYWTRSNEEALFNTADFAKFFDSAIGNKIILVTDKSGTSFVRKTIYFTSNTPDIIFSRYTNPSNMTLT